MKAKVKVWKEIEIRSVCIDINIRYVGGDDGDIPEDFPLLEGNQWRALVDLDNGIIEDLPGDARSMHVKVCDAGIYTLYDDRAEEVARIAGYVPHGVVPGDYGDYVILDIDENGVITNWPKLPDVSEFFLDDE
jgi:hypothetical protein